MSLIAAGQPLIALDLPFAPPVTTAPTVALRRPKWPALVLLGLGVLLTFGPIVGGLFAKTAAGQQMIDQFSPYMEPSALAHDRADVQTLRAGAAGIDAVYRTDAIPAAQFPGLEDFRQHSPAILGRASSLLAQVRATQPDYDRVAAIGGFDRIPFLLVACGIVSIYGSCVLLAGRRGRARFAAVLVIVASGTVALYPFLSTLSGGAQAGQRMLNSLAPIMTSHEVRQLQGDFIVLVNADGELETSFRQVPRSGLPAQEISKVVNEWPRISSDLASLVGVIDDNIGNFTALDDLNTVTRDLGLGGLGAFPWLLVGVGALSATLAIAALPRRGKEAR